MTSRLRRRLLQASAAAIAVYPFSGWVKPLGYPRLMEGPMVGASSPDAIRVWARASGPHALQLEYSRDPDFASPKSSAAVTVDAAGDFTAVLTADGLEPATNYYYRVLVDGQVDRYRRAPFATRTAPAGAATFRVAFGSCARYQRDPEQRIFTAIGRHAPDAFLWLGDNIYADAESPQAIAEEYRRQRSVASLQPLLRSTPQLAIWDDHDFGYNNSDGTSPIKSSSLDVFRRYWANPSSGLTDVPGVFCEWRYGGVDFFMLDGRYHRDPNASVDGAQKTLLGAGQKRWLKERLAASRAPFKVLACGSGWSKADGPTGDTWAAFLTERNELFDWIRHQRIGGVVCLSGDSHVGELNCIPWSERGGYDIYDFVSSPLAQSTDDGWIEQRPEMRMREVYAGSCNFGVLDFGIEPEPTLRFSLFDDWGQRVWQPLELRAAELVNGVSTWRERIDAVELERRGARAAALAPPRSSATTRT
jgi:alkaline phosphatase D